MSPTLCPTRRRPCSSYPRARFFASERCFFRRTLVATDRRIRVLGTPGAYLSQVILDVTCSLPAPAAGIYCNDLNVLKFARIFCVFFFSAITYSTQISIRVPHFIPLNSISWFLFYLFFSFRQTHNCKLVSVSIPSLFHIAVDNICHVHGNCIRPIHEWQFVIFSKKIFITLTVYCKETRIINQSILSRYTSN